MILKQIKNGDQEHVILLRFPFHEAPTIASAFQHHSNAVRLMFEMVPPEHWLAVLGRFNRKLVKRMQYFQKLQENQNDSKQPHRSVRR
ncbi:MAG TPA: hypothetical protein VF905_04195 [Nitrospirota bacterium]